MMDPSFGHLGSTLDSLAHSNFANWFHLEPTGEDSTVGAVVYQPSGPAFRTLVVLSADAPSGSLRRLELRVARSFIDDLRQGMFARDFIKSFIQAVAPTPIMANLAEEIMFRSAPGPVLMRGEPPTLRAEPSEAFLAVTGRVDKVEMREAHLELSFVNVPLPEPHLTIEVGFA